MPIPPAFPLRPRLSLTTKSACSAMAAAHDRALLTLSAGAFSGSILFYEKIAPHLQARGWLVAAWFFFGLCVIVVVSSFRASEKAHRKELDTMDTGGTPDAEAEDWIASLNDSAGLLFGVGMACLFIFAACNMLAATTAG